MSNRYTVEFLGTKEFMSMQELGILLGSNQKRIGLALANLGLWIIDKEPTAKAIDGGYVSLRYYPGFDKYPLTVWHREKTIAVLQAASEDEYPDEDNNFDSDSEDEDLLDEDENFRTFTNN